MNRYSVLLPFNDLAQMEIQKDEFISYLLLDESDVPTEVWNKGTITVDKESRASLFSADVIWAYLSSRKRADGNPEFFLLSQVLVARVFSTVRKNKTPFSTKLGP